MLTRTSFFRVGAVRLVNLLRRGLDDLALPRFDVERLVELARALELDVGAAAWKREIIDALVGSRRVRFTRRRSDLLELATRSRLRRCPLQPAARAG
jgi:hypothetical protein